MPRNAGAELLDELKPEPSVALEAGLLLAGQPQEVGPQEWLTYKPRWGAFYRTALEGHLRALGMDTVVVCDRNLPNSPRTTIYEASERDFNIVFLHDATSGVYARGLEELRGIGVVIQDADECASWLRETPFVSGPA